MPNYIFDGNWYVVNSPFRVAAFNQFFTKTVDENIAANISLKTFFPNSYVYHWHNCWKCKILSNSYVGILEKEVNNTFSEIIKNKNKV